MLTTRTTRQLLALTATATTALATASTAGAAPLRHCQPTAQDYGYGVQTVSANSQTSCMLADNFALAYERDVSLQSDVRPYTSFTLGQGPNALQFQLRFGTPPGSPATVRVRARQVNGGRWISFDAGQ